MHPLSFAGALLTGLGVLLLLHGGARTAVREVTDADGREVMTRGEQPIVPGIGGLVMAAGFGLAGFGARRAAFRRKLVDSPIVKD